MKLILDNEVWKNLNNHAEEDYPNECCGFLFGEDGEERRITQAKSTTNISNENQQRRFQIDPKDYQEAERFASDNNIDLLGIYHSHPDHAAEPSKHDRVVALPYFSYVIVSVHDKKTSDIRSWRLNEERQFEEESILKQTTEINH